MSSTSLSSSTITHGISSFNSESEQQQQSIYPNLTLGRYAISTILNQPSSRNNNTTSFTSAIPSAFKPSAFAALVSRPISSTNQSVLTPSHKRSAPPPLKLTEPPKISISDFEPYLDQIKGEWTQWEKNLNLGSDGAVNFRQSNQADSSSNQTSSNLIDPQTLPASNSLLHRLKQSEPPDLSAVPSVFFQSDFTISNPTTFDIVTETSSQSKSNQPNSESDLNSTSTPLSIHDLATDQILQEKLSHYLDVVELNLVEEISKRSASFFSALGNLQSLHSQTASCISQVEALNIELNQLNESVAEKGLKIIQLGHRRRNISKLEEGLMRVHEVWESVTEIEAMVQAGDWITALGLIESLEEIWKSENSSSADRSKNEVNSIPTLRLHKLKALNALPVRLSNLRTSISRTLEADLISILLHDLKMNVQDFSTNGRQWDSEDPKSPSHDSQTGTHPIQVKDRIQPSLHGLMRASNLEKVMTMWREAVMREVRDIVKNTLASVTDIELDDKDDLSTPVDSNPRDKRVTLSEKTFHQVSYDRTVKFLGSNVLSHDEFLGIARDTYTSLLGCLQALKIQSDAFFSIAEEVYNQQLATKVASNSIADDLSESELVLSSPTKIQDDAMNVEKSESSIGVSVDLDALKSDMNEVVQAAAELANLRFSKVIGVRTEVHASLSLRDFFAIFDISWKFVVKCEVISRRMIVALRGVMVGQAKAFLQAFHQNKITESAKIVEQEQWAQVDVPVTIQYTVNQIIASAVKDPPDLLLAPRDTIVLQSSKGEGEGEDLDGGNSSQAPAKQLDIEGTSLHTVGAVLETLKTLANYLQVVVNFSLLTTDTMGKIVEFLKAFNSRTCQVVLGAGAMRSAGLKNITAKHLALASQALSIMIQLIPYIRECLRRHLSMKQAVMLVDFDKIKRDYQEHQNEIHSKLISIMSDRLSVHLQTLQSIEWETIDESLDSKPNGANGYLESLFKEVGTLHKVLSRYLTPSTLEHIMSQVFKSINTTLAEFYQNLNLQSDQAYLRLIRDINFLVMKEVELKANEEIRSKAIEILKEIEDKLNELKSSRKIIPPISTTPTVELGNEEKVQQPHSTFRSTFRFLSPRSPKAQTPVLPSTPPSAPSPQELPLQVEPEPQPQEEVAVVPAEDVKVEKESFEKEPNQTRSLMSGEDETPEVDKTISEEEEIKVEKEEEKEKEKEEENTEEKSNEIEKETMHDIPILQEEVKPTHKTSNLSADVKTRVEIGRNENDQKLEKSKESIDETTSRPSISKPTLSNRMSLSQRLAALAKPDRRSSLPTQSILDPPKEKKEESDDQSQTEREEMKGVDGRKEEGKEEERERKSVEIGQGLEKRIGGGNRISLKERLAAVVGSSKVIGVVNEGKEKEKEKEEEEENEKIELGLKMKGIEKLKGLPPLPDSPMEHQLNQDKQVEESEGKKKRVEMDEEVENEMTDEIKGNVEVEEDKLKDEELKDEDVKDEEVKDDQGGNGNGNGNGKEVEKGKKKKKGKKKGKGKEKKDEKVRFEEGEGEGEEKEKEKEVKGEGEVDQVQIEIEEEESEFL
ncbi:hypothetical protein DFH28DRAFT_1109143 [Melampsora americana]|nr:hypothetical protein DFH28DRAFT_1109143 [Melampsora americana]